MEDKKLKEIKKMLDEDDFEEFKGLKAILNCENFHMTRKKQY